MATAGHFAGLISSPSTSPGWARDAIWLSPIHPLLNCDWGDDVSDDQGVHPDYGTLEEFQALEKAAHARGLRIILDEALAHNLHEDALVFGGKL